MPVMGKKATFASEHHLEKTVDFGTDFSLNFFFYKEKKKTLNVSESMSNVDRTRNTHAAVAAVSAVCSSQRVGAFVPDTILAWLSVGTPSGSRQGHPRYTGARSAGRRRGWPRSQFQHSSKRAETRQNMVAEQCRFQGKNVGSKSIVDESLVVF